jgi:RNA polymerase sigma-70 factor (ECF subfamily)
MSRYLSREQCDKSTGFGSLPNQTPLKEGVRLMNAFIPSANNSVIMRSLNEMSDTLLVSAAKAGDVVAFDELSTRHSEMILRKTYRIVKNWQDAEDVLQDSFMKAFVHLKDFEERSSFCSWLTRIAINSALMILRKKCGRIEISTDTTDDEFGIRERWEPRDRAESPESRCARREREGLLRRTIQQLPPLLRDVVQLRHIEDRSMEEVAQVLGISVPAAKSRLTRARVALRTSLPANNW